MKDASYANGDVDLDTFVTRLIDRLNEIPGSIWSTEVPPWHTSYGDWHILGTVPFVEEIVTGKEKTSISSLQSSSESTVRLGKWDDHGSGRRRTVAARVSKNTLRLERQYQMNKTLLDEWDPKCERHLRAIQLIRLPSRAVDEVPLTAILMDHPEPNLFRDVLNFGPNWYMATSPPHKQAWNPHKVSSGRYDFPNISLAEFLDFAIGACACCEMIHQGNRFVHGEIRGDSFSYFREYRKVLFLNYGSGVRAFENGLTSAGWSTLTQEFGVEHKLQFIAPEQTGRFQAVPDSRTDLYSLGIVFYNLLTGEVPFQGSTPLEIMQNVLSRRVPALSSKRPDVPEALSAVIGKMVEKNIDDRYHSASGLKWDLKQIQKLLNESDCASLMDFKIGSQDTNSSFILPTVLVGREEEQQIILSVMERLAAPQQKSVSSPKKGLVPPSPGLSANQSRRGSVAPPEDIVSNGDSIYSKQSDLVRQSSSVRDVHENEAETTYKQNDEDATMEDAVENHAIQNKDSNKSEQHISDFKSRSFSMTNLSEVPSLGLTTSHKLKRTGRTELIALYGPPGLGKSSLVQSIHPNARNRGYFCSGKFDPLKKIPFEPVLQVMSSLFRQIFSEVDLDTPFHMNFRTFIRPVWSIVAPMLNLPEWLCDNQRHRSRSPVQQNNIIRPRRTSSPTSGRNSTVSTTTEPPRSTAVTKSARFTAIFIDILRFLSASKLLLFCLEDVQCADDESLDLLLSTVQSKVPMLLILTYKERSALNAKAQALLSEESASLTEIELPPLTEDQIAQYVSKTLHRSTDYIFPLVAVVSEKTGGNPFFVREMLQKCYAQKCISYSWAASQWTYDLDMVFATFESPDYGSQMNNDFILARLLDLPLNSRTFLAWATLIGSTFSYSLVKRLMLGKGEINDEISAQPRPAPKADLVRQASQDVVRGLQGAVAAFVIQPGFDDDHFSFCHDRYQQAAASLPECRDKDEMHFSIAQVMIKNHDGENDVFDLAGHVCAALDLIKAKVLDRSNYRALLSHAAEKATGTGGKTSALKYYSSALALLQRNPWDESKSDVRYNETLSLFQHTADCYWCEGYIEPALALLQTIFRKSRVALDKVPAYVLQSRIFMRHGDGVSAFRVVKQCLSELGFKIPEVTWEQCDARFNELRKRMGTFTSSTISLSPLNKDPILNACTNLLGELMASAWHCDSLLYYQIALLEIELFLERGNTAQAGLGFVHTAAVCICRFDLVQLGCDLGRFAINLFGHYEHDAYIPGRGQALYCMLVGPCEIHISALLPILDNALDRCLAAGDNDFALLAVGITAAVRFWASQDVVEVENYCNWAPEEINGWQDDNRGGVIVTATRQFCRALAGKTRTSAAATVLSDDDHDAEAYLAHICRRSSNPERSRSTYSTFSLAALYLFGYYAEAVELGISMTKNNAFFWSIRFMVSNTFFVSMAQLAMLRMDLTLKNKNQILEDVRSRRERLIGWSVVNDVNFVVYITVLSAQLHEFEGEYEKCVLAYEAALDHAEVHTFGFDQALTAELYAEYLIRRGANRPARHMLLDAAACYRKVSAFGKAQKLFENHQWLLQGTSSLNRSDVGCQTAVTLPPKVSDSSSRGAPSCGQQIDLQMSNSQSREKNGVETLGLDMIDFNAVQSASQVLSSELNVDRLLSKMTKVIMDFSGAELVSIVVEDEEKGLIIAALSDSIGTEYPSGEALHDSATAQNVLAKNILLNSVRFSENYLVPNILEDERFSKLPEEYRYSRQGRAVCVMPLSQGDQMVFGAVYLEGPPHSFNERNASVLRLLINPMSISITNATLFKKVQKVSASNAVMVESQRHALAQAREAEQKAKLAEAEAMRNVRLTEEAVRAKSMFLANVSHELRTPLNGVIGMSELLKSSKLNAEQEGYADSIRVCADTLLTVINDILDFSKLEAGKLQMFSVPLSLTETIAEVVRALSYSNTKKSLRTVMQIELDKDMLVMSDPIRLHQVLMNLLSNSYKFTSQGSVTVKAVVDHEDEREIQVTCSVADTGIGISEEQKLKLFKPFSQADSSTARTYGGTGLGLSIVKAIVENVMKGKIWLDSIPGQGTTVYFTLKFPKVARGSAAAQDTMRSGRADPMSFFSTESKPITPTTTPSGAAIDISQLPRQHVRVCIAEDNPINQKIAISYVQKLGYACQAFFDGRQAVDALINASTSGNPFHVVLMDVQMPVLDGYDATREIRKCEDPAVRDVVIIAMTASAIRGDREKCLEAGMNNYLAKPVRQQVLKQMLDGYLA